MMKNNEDNDNLQRLILSTKTSTYGIYGAYGVVFIAELATALSTTLPSHGNLPFSGTS